MNKDILKDEIHNIIKVWTNKLDADYNWTQEYFEGCCSIWSSIEELQCIFEDEGEFISIEDLKTSNWCVELSNGEVLMLG